MGPRFLSEPFSGDVLSILGTQPPRVAIVRLGCGLILVHEPQGSARRSYLVEKALGCWSPVNDRGRERAFGVRGGDVPVLRKPSCFLIRDVSMGGPGRNAKCPRNRFGHGRIGASHSMLQERGSLNREVKQFEWIAGRSPIFSARRPRSLRQERLLSGIAQLLGSSR